MYSHIVKIRLSKDVTYQTGILLLCIVLTGSLHAQDRFSVQVRPEVSFATTEFCDANFKNGFGFEVNFTYRFMPYVSVYTGWGWNKFSVDQSFVGTNGDFEETGYACGLQFIHPFHENLSFDYFLKAGAIYNHIEVENSDGVIVADSGHGFGFQVETGLSFSLNDKLKPIPGIKYQTLERGIGFEGTSYIVDLNYLSVGLNLLRVF